MSSGKSKSGAIGSRRPSAARERSRVQNLREAFQSLQSALPAVPPSTKLSKLDVLLMASAYIAQLGRLLEEESPAFFLDQQSQQTVIFHPVKKWPMRARLYAGLTTNSNMQTNQQPPPN